ncbi:acid-resistance protein [Salmonella enterica subsp. enterica serovar Senftenberg]|nr:acid-resistance protein [Salmonella enterica subsp. enterica serovar Senftenberg]
MSLWDALRMNMMISYQELVRTFPKGMSCQEFVDLNPQTMAPVAFWVLNEDEDFKGGDYVDFQETETTAVPLAVELCKKNPQSELSKIKDEIKKELSK